MSRTRRAKRANPASGVDDGFLGFAGLHPLDLMAPIPAHTGSNSAPTTPTVSGISTRVWPSSFSRMIRRTLFAYAHKWTSMPQSTFLVLFVLTLVSAVWMHLTVLSILNKAAPQLRGQFEHRPKTS